ncbi:hypothetical protein ACFY1U_25510 [Streptomyces sp. NPDC001351]|uniref:hypothetical protein n=1 Tax=Streptomyces sp. NPDC001351 TaxID=3364564 RepID=UPI0036B955E2
MCSILRARCGWSRSSPRPFGARPDRAALLAQHRRHQRDRDPGAARADSTSRASVVSLPSKYAIDHAAQVPAPGALTTSRITARRRLAGRAPLLVARVGAHGWVAGAPAHDHMERGQPVEVRTP